MAQKDFAQADLSDPAVWKACGLKLKDRNLVSDDKDEMVIIELNDDQLADIAARQAK
jgi:hypothetical protein